MDEEHWGVYADGDWDDRRSRSGSPPSPAGSLHVPRVRYNIPVSEYTRAWVDNTTAVLEEEYESKAGPPSDENEKETKTRPHGDEYMMSIDSEEKKETCMDEQDEDKAPTIDPDSIKTWPQVMMDYGEIYALNPRQQVAGARKERRRQIWTDREESLFVVLIEDFGPNWARIRDHLPRFSIDDVRSDPERAILSTVTDQGVAQRPPCPSRGSSD
jgi:hypothetical protein